MTRRSSLVLIALICTGCVSHPRPALVPMVDEADEIKAADAVQYKSIRVLDAEAQVLALAKSVARHDGATLVLTREDGKTTEIADTPQCARRNRDVHCVRYVLSAWLPSRHAFVVAEIHYEGSGYLLIDSRTGERLAIASPPHFSPDGSRFATFDNDEESGGDGARLWVRQGPGFVSEWNKQAEIEFVGWDGNARLLVKIGGKPAALVKGASGWTL